MFKDIKSLIIKGGFYEDGVTLNLFFKEKDRFSIIYGRNGSGKSSISKAIRAYKNNDKSEYNEIEFKNFDNESISFDDYDKKNIHVFDSSYIEKNIKFSQDGIKSIVMFGRKLILDEKINDLEVLLKSQKNKIIILRDKLDNFNDKKQIDSPEHIIEGIKKTLNRDNGWADNDSKLRNSTNKTSVNDNIIHEIGKIQVSNNKIGSIQTEFSKSRISYEKVKNDNNSILSIIYKVESEINDISIKKILSVKVDKPKVTSREKKILSTIQNGKQFLVEEALEIFSNDAVNTCPYCYQPISKGYRERLIVEINHIFNKQVEEHKKELENIRFPIVNLNLSDFNIINESLVVKIEKQYAIFNRIIEEYKILINRKINNIFTPLQIPNLGMEICLEKLNTMIRELDRQRVLYNRKIDNKDVILERLLLLNKRLASSEIRNQYKDYCFQIAAEEKVKISIKELNKFITENEKKENEYKSTKKNIKIASEKINEDLEYIFFNKNRMHLDVVNESYYIKTFGKNVENRNISEGECNILALSYFFSQIMEQCNQAEEYSQQMLIVVDDPISSFDFGNKVGIQSYLRYQMNKIITGNNNSKMVIQTHDICTVFDLDKSSDEILKSILVNDNVKYSTSLLELKNKTLMKFSKIQHEYSRLMINTYNFAKEVIGFEKHDFEIGNEMRKLLEAYSSFAYRLGIAQISTDKGILKKLGNKKYTKYFENLMYRLVLHGESHMQEKIQDLNGNNFFDFISLEEKVRTAKDIIVFLFLLNEEHVLKHLLSQYDKNEIKIYEPIIRENIVNWKNNIS